MPVDRRPWSNATDAPQVPYVVYFHEKVNMAGTALDAISYGVVIVLFFRCMDALLNPINRKMEGLKWPLVAHTVAMFSFVTINCGMNLALQSFAYVDNRGPTPGPYNFEYCTLYSNPMNTIPEVMFFLNMWLADGLLLYRCWIIYGMNYRVIAFPCLIYLGFIVTGILEMVQYLGDALNSTIQFVFVYLPLSLSLTIILTSMIVTRLVLHGKNMKNAVGSGAGSTGVYKTIVTMFVESYALYAIAFIVCMGFRFTGNAYQLVFRPLLSKAQVIAPFLVILRVANRRALTSTSVASGNVGSMQFRGQGESTADDCTISYGNDPTSSTATNIDSPGSTVSGPKSLSTKFDGDST